MRENEKNCPNKKIHNNDYINEFQIQCLLISLLIEEKDGSYITAEFGCKTWNIQKLCYQLHNMP